MKTINEIGYKKGLKFFLYSVYEVIIHRFLNHLLYFPIFRKISLQLVGASIGNLTQIMDVKFFNWHHRGPGGLKIGNECFIGDETLIDLYDSVVIGNQVTIAQRVTMLTHLNVGYQNHPLQKYFPKQSKPINLEDGCVVGASATILPGVTVGKESFIAAGSVVTADIPPNSLYAGVPAKLVRKIR